MKWLKITSEDLQKVNTKNIEQTIKEARKKYLWHEISWFVVWFLTLTLTVLVIILMVISFDHINNAKVALAQHACQERGEDYAYSVILGRGDVAVHCEQQTIIVKKMGGDTK